MSKLGSHDLFGWVFKTQGMFMKRRAKSQIVNLIPNH